MTSQARRGGPGQSGDRTGFERCRERTQALSKRTLATAWCGTTAINKRVAEMTALRRAGVPDDIGPMIAGLLSEENRWVNGQTIEVSGGMAL